MASFIIRARFETDCVGCPERIFEGQLVQKTEEGWRHRECPEPRNALCPECFIHHAGECA